jgi:hypothetical protein
MIRRSTLVVFVLFVIALAALIVLQRAPNSPLKPATTPLPTALPNMILGWKSADVSVFTAKSADGKEKSLTRNSDGSWAYGALTIEGGEVEQLLSELLATHIIAQMPVDLSLKDMLLETPAQVITLQSSDGRSLKIQIGSITPTQSGYYIRIDNNQAVVVNKGSLDTVLQLLDEVGQPTPTPIPTPTAQAAPQ